MLLRLSMETLHAHIQPALPASKDHNVHMIPCMLHRGWCIAACGQTTWCSTSLTSGGACLAWHAGHAQALTLPWCTICGTQGLRYRLAGFKLPKLGEDSLAWL